VSRPSLSAAIALAILVLGALVAAGCGDSGSSNEDFVAEADQICTQQTADSVKVEDRLGYPLSLEEGAEFQGELAPIRQEGLEQLEGLEAPDELADDWDRYLAARRESGELREEQVKLLEAGDEEKVKALNAEIEANSDELEKAAKDVGMEACGRILPADQREEVVDVVEEVALTTDPKLVCRDLVTPGYLELGFEGSYEECAEFQRKNADKFATDVEIDDVEGVADTQAVVKITDVDGQFAGEESAWTLVHRDDGWKVAAIITS
jgi:hypothetical protein